MASAVEKIWADQIANGRKSYSDVPEKYKEGCLSALQEKLASGDISQEAFVSVLQGVT